MRYLDFGSAVFHAVEMMHAVIVISFISMCVLPGFVAHSQRMYLKSMRATAVRWVHMPL